MNSVTLIGTVAERCGDSAFVLAVEREGASTDLIPIAWPGNAVAGERLAVEAALRVQGEEVEVEATAVHSLPHMATI